MGGETKLTTGSTARSTTGVSRVGYLDNIRIFLTGLVVLHHFAITYGAPGWWFYVEQPVDGLTGAVLFPFVAINQAYFMGFSFCSLRIFCPGRSSARAENNFYPIGGTRQRPSPRFVSPLPIPRSLHWRWAWRRSPFGSSRRSGPGFRISSRPHMHRNTRDCFVWVSYSGHAVGKRRFLARSGAIGPACCPSVFWSGLGCSL